MTLGLKQLILTLKGCAMGAADVIPGVSGGTIAFISGIYEELINSIKSIDFEAVKLLCSFKLKDFWKHINGNFLLFVILGIGISIFSLAKLMTWLLDNHPIEIWSFFFGLIVASSILVSKEITRWRAAEFITLFLGIIVAFVITILSPSQTPETWWFILLSGAIAICAMILPGISGAFILLLLGKYQFIMHAVSTLDFPVIITFAIGAILGITSFSHLLSWLLNRYHNVTIAVLTGFMVGSLNKVWPWKEVTEWFTNSHGLQKPLTEVNILPSSITEISIAIFFGIVGFLLITLIERYGKKLKVR